MITLTKLDNQTVLINLETVKYIEQVPDTIVFFTNGDSLMVKESLEDISEKFQNMQAAILKTSKS